MSARMSAIYKKNIVENTNVFKIDMSDCCSNTTGSSTNIYMSATTCKNSREKPFEFNYDVQPFNPKQKSVDKKVRFTKYIVWNTT